MLRLSVLFRASDWHERLPQITCETDIHNGLSLLLVCTVHSQWTITVNTDREQMWSFFFTSEFFFLQCDLLSQRKSQTRLDTGIKCTSASSSTYTKCSLINIWTMNIWTMNITCSQSITLVYCLGNIYLYKKIKKFFLVITKFIYQI